MKTSAKYFGLAVWP